MMRYWLVWIGLFLCCSVQAQQEDTLRTVNQSEEVASKAEKVKPHSPKKASLLSAVLPGAGQIYNRKYWKLPLVYGGMGISLYLALDYRDQYQRYRTAYRYLVDDDSTTVSEFEGALSTGVRDTRDTYRRWMEMSYIAMGLIYVLQIVDANVDAHLMEFDVSDDLSLKVMPDVIHAANSRTPAAGITLTLRPKRKR